MSSILLSAALIVRNEARYLDDCLASISGLVDEAVVVDTGSTDDTKAIAARRGARVFDFPWCDDFAAARNRALELARGAWILYIDADERTRCADPAALRAQLGDPRFIGLQVRFHVHSGHTPYPELRLFRNDPRIRFESVIHETVWPSILRQLARGNGQVGASDLEIVHLGYVGDLAHKAARNLPFLERAVQSDPDRVYLWCELAKTYDAQNRQADAARAFRKALSIVRAREVTDAGDVVAYIDAFRWRVQRGRPPDRLLVDGLRRFPTNGQLQWNHACRLLERRDFERALAAFQALLSAHDLGVLDPTVAYDLRIFGVFGYEAMATCCFKLGRYAEAARYFARALAEEPEHAALRAKLQMAERFAPPDNVVTPGPGSTKIVG